MEAQDNVAILTVSEALELDKIAVVRAGLSKLVRSGKKDILVDFTGLLAATALIPRFKEEVLSLKIALAQMGAHLVCVGSIQDVTDVPTREEGLHLLSSTLAKLSIQVSVLKHEIAHLSHRREELARAVEQAGATGDVRALKKENSDLRAKAVHLEAQIQMNLKGRREPYSSTVLAAKKADLESVLKSVLAQQRLIPVT
jgi:hypothetical protein